MHQSLSGYRNVSSLPTSLSQLRFLRGKIFLSISNCLPSEQLPHQNRREFSYHYRASALNKEVCTTTRLKVPVSVSCGRSSFGGQSSLNRIASGRTLVGTTPCRVLSVPAICCLFIPTIPYASTPHFSVSNLLGNAGYCWLFPHQGNTLEGQRTGR